MRNIHRTGIVLLATVLLSAAEGEKPPVFESDIAPVLKARCWACHSGASPQAGLDLQTVASVLKGGKSGPAVRPGASDASLLLDKIVSKAMPPGDPKLSGNEIALIRAWIDKGLTRPAAPELISEADVLPIFQMRCVVCHGKRKQEGGLDLRTLVSRLKGGKSGPALVPGKPEESLLMQKIASGQMPPPKLL